MRTHAAQVKRAKAEQLELLLAEVSGAAEVARLGIRGHTSSLRDVVMSKLLLVSLHVALYRRTLRICLPLPPSSLPTNRS